MDSAPDSGRRILVVDDDPAIRALLRERLGLLGYETVEAENGRIGSLGAIDGTPVRPLHGVLLDMSMADALTVLHTLRRQHPDIPIIVMSRASDVHIAREAVNQGADEYVLKPFDQELLKAKCLRVF
ncbi:MAG TPA: response regulator [Nitrospiraceae bacterium]|nr:response regulator [Nitrospiraceae bacterium]